MSIKIYNGLKCKTSDMQKAIDFLHEQMYSNAIARAKNIKSIFEKEPERWYKRYVETRYAGREEAKEDFKLFSEECPEWIPTYYAMCLTTRSSQTRSISPFDIDCSFNMFIVGKKCLIIPYGPEKISFAKLPNDGLIEEYGYWNNTDEPEDVTMRQWKQRKKDWEVACEIDSFWKKRISHTVIELKSSIGQYEVSQSLLKWSDEKKRKYMGLFSDDEKNDSVMEEFGVTKYKDPYR